MKYIKSILKGLFWIALVLAIILVIGRFTFWVPGEAPDNAMAPTIWKGDKFLVLTRGQIDLGSIVYCDHPVYAGQVVLGRVVGLPGDTVEMVGDQLRINDEPVLQEWNERFTYIDKTSAANLMNQTFIKAEQFVGGHRADLMYPDGSHKTGVRLTKVKAGFFLLGDNRTLALGASDSRSYGEVHETLCKGRVLFIWKAVKGLGDPDLSTRAFNLVF
jgi:signal peptidase I